MTRFKVRRKLRKACSKAKYLATGTLGIGQGNGSHIAFSTYVKQSTMKVGAFSLIGIAGVFYTIPSQAVVINLNDFSGWEKIGDVSVNDGTASLTTGATSDTDIEQFLGLASESLDNFNNINATFGSAIKQTITVNAGDSIDFNWSFKTTDYLPFNDFSFYTIGSSIYKLADVSSVGNYGQKESTTSFSVQSPGTYTIGFGVINAGDNGVSSNLNVGTPVPEPLTILGSLAAGGVGAALRRKYKQQKDTAKV
jgi:hypothetical protein